MSMIQRMRAWARGEEYTPPKPEAEDTPAAGTRGMTGSIFSTDLPFPRDSLSKWIGENTLLATPENFTAISGDGFESMAVDEAITQYGMDSTTLKNSFIANSQNLPEVLYAWYVSQGFIGYSACATISQHWLVNKALMIPGKDAVRNGYTVARNDGEELKPEMIEAIKQCDKKFKIKRNLIEFETNKRRFGIRVALFVVESDDKEYYRKPFNIDGIKKGSYKGISQIDPQWMSPVLDAQTVANPASIDFYEPTWWQINGKLYHKSHLAVVRYSDVADVLKPTYQYGGLPLTQLIFERVYAAERTANEAPMLAETKRLTTINTDIAAIAANPEKFEQNLALLTHYRNNYGIFVQGLEESMTQFDTSLAELDGVIMTQYQLVASVAGVPATKLLETSPKGFNATGEYEQESYNDTLETVQDDMDIILDRHHDLCIKSEIAPKFGVEAFSVETVWNPVSSPNAKEQAEINQFNSITDSNNVMAGAVSGEEVREKLIADPKSGYNGLKSVDVEREDTDDDDDLLGDGQDSAELGFVSVKPERMEAKKIFDWAYEAGIKNGLSPEKMHITLAHDKTGIENYKPNSDEYIIDFTGEIGVLGEGEYQGLVLFVESEELRKRHEEIKGMGAEWKFDKYRPHITIKYQPEDGDLELAKAAFSKIGLNVFEVSDEKIELVK